MERFFIDKSNRKDVITAGMRRRYRREDGTFDVIIKEKWDQAMKDGIFMHEGYVANFKLSWQLFEIWQIIVINFVDAPTFRYLARHL